MNASGALDLHRMDAYTMLNRSSRAYELEPFEGNPLEWVTFQAQYYKSTRDCSFTEMDNHARLGRCLRGQARDHVRDLLNSQVDKAEEMMSVLRASCGLPSFVTAAALRSLHDFPPMPPTATWADLLDLSVVVRNAVSLLEAYPELTIDHENILAMLFQKLSLGFKQQWAFEARYLPAGLRITLTMFSDWLKMNRNGAMRAGASAKELTNIKAMKKHTTRTTLAMAAEPEYPELTTPPTSESSRAPPPTPAASAPRNPAPRTTRPPAPRKPATECELCGWKHKLDTCKEFLGKSPPGRQDIATRYGLCFRCLRPGHMAQGCNSTKKCEVCGRNHHTALHDVGETNA